MVAGRSRPPSRNVVTLISLVVYCGYSTTKRAKRDKFTVSVVLQRERRATKRALALYTITIDRVYDSKA